MSDHPAFPTHLTAPQPIGKVLATLGFAKAPLGLSCRWSGVEFTAYEDEFGCLLMRAGVKTRREAWPPHDSRVRSLIAPIELMAKLYEMWADLFAPASPPDAHLRLGKEWLDYQRDLRALIPPPPTIWAERQFFRHCLTYIERLHDWADADYDIVFSQLPGQLRIRARETEVHCPAGGKWVGEAAVSARELFRRIPKRLMGPTASLRMDDNKLLIDGHPIAAAWREQGDSSSA